MPRWTDTVASPRDVAEAQAIKEILADEVLVAMDNEGLANNLL